MSTPSKELLSAVFKPVITFSIEKKNVKYSTGAGSFNYYSVNIYELAIKTKQAYPSLDLNLAATDISEFWRQANELVRGANNE